MFETYTPENFCKEYVLIKGTSSQLSQFIAVVKGVKPLMDDWVHTDRYSEYKRMCKRYGLFVKPDSKIVPASEDFARKSIGGKRLCTTKFIGYPLNSNLKNCGVHVFISRSKKHLIRGYKNGGYPIIIKGRAMHKPYIDLIKFGFDLGYPRCCIDFFIKYNNHFIYNHLYEALKNTKGEPIAFCNSITKDNTYSYVYNIPCSFNCKNSIKFAKEIKKAIYEEEPMFTKRIDEHLKLPLLVFEEQNAYAFKGRLRKNRLFYSDVFFLGRGQNNIYENRLRKGNCLKVSSGVIEILKDGSPTDSIKKSKASDGFLIKFD